MSADEETDRVPLVDLALEVEARRKATDVDRVAQFERDIDDILDRLEQQQKLLREILHDRALDHTRHRRVQERFDQHDRRHCELRDEMTKYREMFAELDAFTRTLASDLAAQNLDDITSQTR